MSQLLRVIRSDILITTRTVTLNDPVAGFHQVETTDDENADNYPETRRPRVSGRGD